MTTTTATPSSNGTATGKRMSLANVRRGRIERPLRILAYGPDGVGKSTFASNAPDPIFLCAESGTDGMDVARLPEPYTWNEVFEGLRELANEQHDFKTIVIDTVDWLEPLLFRYLVERDDKATSIDEVAGGFQKGYLLAITEWRRFLGALEYLWTDRGMNVVLLAHSVVREFKNPNGEDFERWTLKLWESKNANTPAVFREWADMVLFLNYEVFTKHTGDERRPKTKGVGDGARFIHTTWKPMFDAKTRFALPPRLPLSWAELVAHVEQPRPVDPAKAIAALEELIPKLDAADQASATTYLGTVRDDAKKLAEFLSYVESKIDISGAGS